MGEEMLCIFASDTVRPCSRGSVGSVQSRQPDQAGRRVSFMQRQWHPNAVGSAEGRQSAKLLRVCGQQTESQLHHRERADSNNAVQGGGHHECG